METTTVRDDTEKHAGFGVLAGVRSVVGTCSAPQGERTVAEWMELIGEISEAMTVLAAARDAAIVRLAAIEERVDEDGVVREQVNGLGTVCIDAAAMVSMASGTTTRFAEELVAQAVTRTVRVPALGEAMVDGVLDDYQARCIASELHDVPPELARTVVTALAQGDMGSRSGLALRSRTRKILFALSPDLLREQLIAARERIGLRRRVSEPGTDEWVGTFPSEDAAMAWAAVDALARRYKNEGRYVSLERARAHALMDLVNANATVKAVLRMTVPADTDRQAITVSDGHHDEITVGDDHVPRGEAFDGVAGIRGQEISWLPRRWLASQGDPRDPRSGRDVAKQTKAPKPWVCHRDTGALLDADRELATDAYRPGDALQALIRDRDARCRFPGCVISARSCDIDHVIPYPEGPTSAENLICICRRHHRVKQRRRWHVVLNPDATVTWRDPGGAPHTTWPVDHLGTRELRSIEHVVNPRGPLEAVNPRGPLKTSAAGSEPAMHDEPRIHDWSVIYDEPTMHQGSTMHEWDESTAETLLSIRLEHLVAAAAADVKSTISGSPRTGGSECRSPARRRSVRRRSVRRRHIATVEDIDRASAAITAGEFATFDEAFDEFDRIDRHASLATAAGQASYSGSRIDVTQASVPIIYRFRRRARRRRRRAIRRADRPPF